MQENDTMRDCAVRANDRLLRDLAYLQREGHIDLPRAVSHALHLACFCVSRKLSGLDPVIINRDAHYVHQNPVDGLDGLREEIAARQGALSSQNTEPTVFRLSADDARNLEIIRRCGAFDSDEEAFHYAIGYTKTIVENMRSYIDGTSHLGLTSHHEKTASLTVDTLYDITLSNSFRGACVKFKTLLQNACPALFPPAGNGGKPPQNKL